MSEGHTYRCSWRSTPGGRFEAWLERRPDVRGAGASIDAAVLVLGDRIGDLHGDREPQFEFELPLPVPERPADVDLDSCVAVSPFGGMDVQNPADDLVVGDVCPECHFRNDARRTDEQLNVSLQATSATNVLKAGGHFNGYVLVVAEYFVAALTDAERSAVEVRPIRLPPRSRRRAVELVPKAIVPECGIRSLPVLNGMGCPTCGRRQFDHGYRNGWLLAVCRTDLPPTPTLFLAGERRYFHLCMPRDRWRQIKRVRGMSIWSSNRVAVVDEPNCLRDTPLPTPREREDYFERTGRYFNYAQWLAERPTP